MPNNLLIYSNVDNTSRKREYDMYTWVKKFWRFYYGATNFNTGNREEVKILRCYRELAQDRRDERLMLSEIESKDDEGS